MGYRILIADDRLWKKNCAEIPKEELRKILLKIRDLEKDPWPENIKVKHLKDYPVAAFRLRVGNYRVLFNKDETRKVIYLARVLNRSKLY